MKATFENSVDVLVKAYLEGTLAHKVCSACAVGNLIAGSMGVKPMALSKEHVVPFHNGLFSDGTSVLWSKIFMNGEYTGCVDYRAIEQIEQTGYDVEQMRRIEEAFEFCELPDDVDKSSGFYQSHDYYTHDQWMLNGLLAVVDVIAEIHGIDLSAKESAKKLFVKP